MFNWKTAASIRNLLLEIKEDRQALLSVGVAEQLVKSQRLRHKQDFVKKVILHRNESGEFMFDSAAIEMLFSASRDEAETWTLIHQLPGMGISNGVSIAWIARSSRPIEELIGNAENPGIVSRLISIDITPAQTVSILKRAYSNAEILSLMALIQSILPNRYTNNKGIVRYPVAEVIHSAESENVLQFIPRIKRLQAEYPQLAQHPEWVTETLVSPTKAVDQLTNLGALVIKQNAGKLTHYNDQRFLSMLASLPQEGALELFGVFLNEEFVQQNKQSFIKDVEVLKDSFEKAAARIKAQADMEAQRTQQRIERRQRKAAYKAGVEQRRSIRLKKKAEVESQKELLTQQKAKQKRETEKRKAAIKAKNDLIKHGRKMQRINLKEIKPNTIKEDVAEQSPELNEIKTSQLTVTEQAAHTYPEEIKPAIDQSVLLENERVAPVDWSHLTGHELIDALAANGSIAGNVSFDEYMNNRAKDDYKHGWNIYLKGGSPSMRNIREIYLDYQKEIIAEGIAVFKWLVETQTPWSTHQIMLELPRLTGNGQGHSIIKYVELAMMRFISAHGTKSLNLQVEMELGRQNLKMSRPQSVHEVLERFDRALRKVNSVFYFHENKWMPWSSDEIRQMVKEAGVAAADSKASNTFIITSAMMNVVLEWLQRQKLPLNLRGGYWAVAVSSSVIKSFLIPEREEVISVSLMISNHHRRGPPVDNVMPDVSVKTSSKDSASSSVSSDQPIQSTNNTHIVLSLGLGFGPLVVYHRKSIAQLRKDQAKYRGAIVVARGLNAWEIRRLRRYGAQGYITQEGNVLSPGALAASARGTPWLLLHDAAVFKEFQSKEHQGIYVLDARSNNPLVPIQQFDAMLMMQHRVTLARKQIEDAQTPDEVLSIWEGVRRAIKKMQAIADLQDVAFDVRRERGDLSFFVNHRLEPFRLKIIDQIDWMSNQIARGSKHVRLDKAVKLIKLAKRLGIIVDEFEAEINSLVGSNGRELVLTKYGVSAYLTGLDTHGHDKGPLDILMQRLNLKMPRGFILTSAFFTRYLQENAMEEKILGIFRDDNIIDKRDAVRALWNRTRFTADSAQLIRQAYTEVLGGKLSVIKASAMMKSGLHERTYLTRRVKVDQRLAAVKRSWARFFNGDVIGYVVDHIRAAREKRIEFDERSAYPSLLIREQIRVKVSGFIATVNTATRNWNEIIINVAPDKNPQWMNNADNLDADRITLTKKGSKPSQILLGNSRTEPSLSVNEIKRLANFAKAFEKEAGQPILLEFFKDHKGDLYILWVSTLETTGELSDASIYTTLTESDISRRFNGELLIDVKFENEGVDLNKIIEEGQVFVLNLETMAVEQTTGRVKLGSQPQTISLNLPSDLKRFVLKMGVGTGFNREGQPVVYALRGERIILEPALYMITIDPKGNTKVQEFEDMSQVYVHLTADNAQVSSSVNSEGKKYNYMLDDRLIEKDLLSEVKVASSNMKSADVLMRILALNPQGRLGDNRIVFANIIDPSIKIRLDKIESSKYSLGRYELYALSFNTWSFNENQLGVDLNHAAKELIVLDVQANHGGAENRYPARGLSIFAFLRFEALRLGWSVRFVDIQNPRIYDFLMLFFDGLAFSPSDQRGYNSARKPWNPWFDPTVIYKTAIAYPKSDDQIRVSFAKEPVEELLFKRKSIIKSASSSIISLIQPPAYGLNSELLLRWHQSQLQMLEEHGFARMEILRAVTVVLEEAVYQQGLNSYWLNAYFYKDKKHSVLVPLPGVKFSTIAHQFVRYRFKDKKMFIPSLMQAVWRHRRDSELLKVAIAAEGGSGKSRLARKMIEWGVSTYGDSGEFISLDAYRLPREVRRSQNIFGLGTLHLDEIRHLMAQISEGKEAVVKDFDSATGIGRDDRVIDPHSLNMLVLEGTLAYALPEFADFFDVRIFFDMDFPIRYALQLARDQTKRNYTLENAIWKNVFGTYRESTVIREQMKHAHIVLRQTRWLNNPPEIYIRKGFQSRIQDPSFKASSAVKSQHSYINKIPPHELQRIIQEEMDHLFDVWSVPQSKREVIRKKLTKRIAILTSQMEVWSALMLGDIKLSLVVSMLVMTLWPVEFPLLSFAMVLVWQAMIAWQRAEKYLGSEVFREKFSSAYYIINRNERQVRIALTQVMSLMLKGSGRGINSKAFIASYNRALRSMELLGTPGPLAEQTLMFRNASIIAPVEMEQGFKERIWKRSKSAAAFYLRDSLFAQAYGSSLAGLVLAMFSTEPQGIQKSYRVGKLMNEGKTFDEALAVVIFEDLNQMLPPTVSSSIVINAIKYVVRNRDASSSIKELNQKTKILQITNRDVVTFFMDDLIKIEHGRAGAWSKERFLEDVRRLTGERLEGKFDGLSFLAFDEPSNRVVGYLFGMMPNGDYPYATNDSLIAFRTGIAADRKGRGVAILLFVRAAKEALARGKNIVFLEVRENNDKAIRLYERLGFVAVGNHKDEAKGINYIQYRANVNDIINYRSRRKIITAPLSVSGVVSSSAINQNQLILDVAPINHRMIGEVILYRDKIGDYVEEPWLGAAQMLWDKNIRTMGASANGKDIGYGYGYLLIDYESLSKDNRAIVSEHPAWEIISRLRQNLGRLVLLKIAIEQWTTVGAFQEEAIRMAETFVSQPLTWAGPLTLDQIGGEPNAKFYYRDSEGTYYLSQELHHKTRSFVANQHNKDSSSPLIIRQKRSPPVANTSELQQFIRQSRLDHRLSVRTLARLAGNNYTAIYAIEKGIPKTILESTLLGIVQDFYGPRDKNLSMSEWIAYLKDNFKASSSLYQTIKIERTDEFYEQLMENSTLRLFNYRSPQRLQDLDLIEDGTDRSLQFALASGFTVYVTQSISSVEVIRYLAIRVDDGFPREFKWSYSQELLRVMYRWLRDERGFTKVWHDDREFFRVTLDLMQKGDQPFLIPSDERIVVPLNNLDLSRPFEIRVNDFLFRPDSGDLSSSAIDKGDNQSASSSITKLMIEIDARALGRRLSQVDDAFLDWLKSLGAGLIWLKAPWERSPYSLISMKNWQRQNNETIERIASGYDIYRYRPDPYIATHREFQDFARRLKEREIGLVVDFVTNHLAADAPDLLRVSDLGTIYRNPQDYIRAVRAEFTRYRYVSDEEIMALLNERWKGEVHYYRHPDDPSAIIRHAKEGGGEFAPSMPSLAQLRLMSRNARQYMMEFVLPMIARLTLQGGLRADLAHLGLWNHIRQTWGWQFSDNEFQQMMPKDFWEEFMEKVNKRYPGMLVFAEAYQDEHLRRLQSFGLVTYNKIVYDILRSGDTARLRGYTFMDTPYSFLKQSLYFTENHDEYPAIEAFGHPQRMMAAAAITFAQAGHVLVPLRQILGMGTPPGIRKEMKSPDAGIYRYFYPTNDQANQDVLQAFERLMPVMTLPVFRQSRPHSARLVTPHESQLNGLYPVIYHHHSADAVVVVNYSAQPQEISVDLNRIDYPTDGNYPITRFDINNVKIFKSYPGAQVDLSITERGKQLRMRLEGFAYAVVVFPHRASSALSVEMTNGGHNQSEVSSPISKESLGLLNRERFLLELNLRMIKPSEIEYYLRFKNYLTGVQFVNLGRLQVNVDGSFSVREIDLFHANFIRPLLKFLSNIGLNRLWWGDTLPKLSQLMKDSGLTISTSLEMIFDKDAVYFESPAGQLSLGAMVLTKGRSIEYYSGEEKELLNAFLYVWVSVKNNAEQMAEFLEAVEVSGIAVLLKRILDNKQASSSAVELKERAQRVSLQIIDAVDRLIAEVEFFIKDKKTISSQSIRVKLLELTDLLDGVDRNFRDFTDFLEMITDVFRNRITPIYLIIGIDAATMFYNGRDEHIELLRKYVRSLKRECDILERIVKADEILNITRYRGFSRFENDHLLPSASSSLMLLSWYQSRESVFDRFNRWRLPMINAIWVEIGWENRGVWMLLLHKKYRWDLYPVVVFPLWVPLEIKERRKMFRPFMPLRNVTKFANEVYSSPVQSLEINHWASFINVEPKTVSVKNLKFRRNFKPMTYLGNNSPNRVNRIVHGYITKRQSYITPINKFDWIKIPLPLPYYYRRLSFSGLSSTSIIWKMIVNAPEYSRRFIKYEYFTFAIVVVPVKEVRRINIVRKRLTQRRGRAILDWLMHKSVRFHKFSAYQPITDITAFNFLESAVMAPIGMLAPI